MQTIIVFLQRLFSNAGQAEVRKAYMEAAALFASGGILVTAFKAKDFSTIFQQGPEFYSGIVGLCLTVASIFSSNKSALANPNLPNIVGKNDGSEPVNVPVPKN
jgi:hypothetical protein